MSRSNDFGLLAAISGDCAGAVSLRVGGEGAEPAAVEWLEPDALMALLDQLPLRPMLAQRDGLRLSLAGAQDKFPVVFDGQRIGLPRGNTASTHILNPAIAAVKDSVINEAFCMALAKATGLQVADADAQADQADSVGHWIAQASQRGARPAAATTPERRLSGGNTWDRGGKRRQSTHPCRKGMGVANRSRRLGTLPHRRSHPAQGRRPYFWAWLGRSARC